jgi:hypothetical protein
LQEGGLDLEVTALQELCGWYYPFKGHEGYDDRTACPNSGKLDDLLEIVGSCPTDEHSVGFWQIVKRMGRLTLDNLYIDLVASGVFADSVAAFRVFFDGDCGGAETGALDRDRAAPRANVPDEAPGTGTEPGKNEGAGLGFGDHAGAVFELRLG